jgi:hypothetical protein
LPDATAQITDLTTDATRAFLYRRGTSFYNNDHSLVAVLRYRGIDHEDQGIELWNTDTWRNLYTFRPSFGYELDLVPVEIAFSPDNSTLAIVHQGRLTLWDITPFTIP